MSSQEQNFLLAGVPLTVIMTVTSFAVGLVLALPLAWGAQSHWLPVRVVARGVIDVFRAIPPIVLLFLLFFGLAGKGISLSAYESAIAGLGLISAAYLAEVYRGGLLAVPEVQWDAAGALGLNRFVALRRVVGPQAFRVVLPGAATWAIGLLKDSAAVSIIGVQDIAFRAFQESESDLKRGVEIFLIAGLLYVALSVPMALVARWTDFRLRKALAL